MQFFVYFHFNKIMGNWAENEKEEVEPISGETIKHSLEGDQLLNHLEIKALHNRHHWIFENHDHKKSFKTIDFDLNIRYFKKVGSLLNTSIYAFTVENPSHYPFIFFPYSNNYYGDAIRNVRKYIRSKSKSLSQRLFFWANQCE